MKSINGFAILDYFHVAIILTNIEFTAQRQVGETDLNDKSSRSHQIIRLVCSNCIHLLLLYRDTTCIIVFE